MARYVQVVVPGIPYHVTHRGNRRESVFLSDDQREAYRRWLGHYGSGVESGTRGIMRAGRRLAVALRPSRSSARGAHARGEPDGLLSAGRPFPAPERVGGWSAWLAQVLSDEEVSEIRRNTRTGRPCGNESFVDRLEGLLRRLLRPLKRGPRPRNEGN